MGHRRDDDRKDISAPRVALGKWQQLALASGGVLGSGWIGGIALATREVCDPAKSPDDCPEGVLPWLPAFLPWMIGFAVVVLVAVPVVRLARADPRSGGLAWWAQDRSGRIVGTVINAGLFVVYAANPPAGAVAAVIALDAGSGAKWGLTAGEGGQPSWKGGLLALAIMTLLFAVQFFASRWMLRVNVVLSWAKALFLLLFIGSAAIGAFQVLPLAHGGGETFTVLGVTATVGILFAFTGFQGPVDNGDLSGKDHRGFAIYGALIVAAVLYIGLHVVFIVALVRNSPLPESGDLAFPLLIGATVVVPLTNALLFIYLADIVLKTSVEQEVLKFPWLKKGTPLRLLFVIYLFGVACLLVTVADLSEITDSKSVIYLLVYTYAAVCLRASWRARELRHQDLERHSGEVVAPLSFAVASVVSFLAGLQVLLWACVLVGAVTVPMLLSRFREADRNRAEHLRRARWLIGYFAMLLVLAGVQFVVGCVIARDRPGLNLALGFDELSMSAPQQSFIYNVFLVILGAVAAGAGLLFHRWGVREAERFIRLKN